MIAFAKPPALFNPIVAPPDEWLTVWEILSGPFGLIAFVPLIPILRWAARKHKQAALIAAGMIWMIATVGPLAAALLPVACILASIWVAALGRLLARGSIKPPLMLALVWLGLTAMIFPLWWYPQWTWYGWGEPSRMAVLHNIGFAYFYLRLLAWGRELYRDPNAHLRPWDTLCWLLYPPCMRLGPVITRESFLQRFDDWRPDAPLPWKEIAQRTGLMIFGGFCLAVITKNLPHAQTDGNFFSNPELYSTSKLIRAFYFVPIQVYLLLWVYNELAAASSYAVGIRVDNNFNWLPLATSVRDFWRRWHVTVGAWLRENIYIPLGGNRRHVAVTYSAAFGFCAVWHGASWSFVAWAATQVVALMIQRAWDKIRNRLGWTELSRRPWWIALSWLITIHYQLAAIVVFVDFDHLGLRFISEIRNRLL